MSKLIDASLILAAAAGVVLGQAKGVVDPGVRSGSSGAGKFYANVTANQQLDLSNFAAAFQETNTEVQNPFGVGPRFNGDNCQNCHAQPARGGSSPAINQQYSVYQFNGATNTMPFFVTQGSVSPPVTGSPTVNARSPYMPDGITPDGHVQQLFTITGRTDSGGCVLAQPDFAGEAAANNLIFRQTTPTFGSGLIEIIRNSDILANMNANLSQKQALLISGHPSIAADGSISRFGWKAQQRSLTQFTGEAYNIEEGVTNELSMNEIDQTPGCANNEYPEDHTQFGKSEASAQFDGDPGSDANFMRFLQPPAPAFQNSVDKTGQAQFVAIGCALCHTPSFTTPTAWVGVLSNVQANLYSDLLVHHMGPCHADNIVQGNVQGDEFRTAPLWGVGQRVFLMHEGATTDMVQAVEMHLCNAGISRGVSYPASEANAVIKAFNSLSQKNQQAIINFLRTL